MKQNRKIQIKNYLMLILVMTCFICYSPVRAQKDLSLKAELWEAMRHGEKVIEIPVLKQVVAEWKLKSGQKIELRYPGGEEGELWVQELMDWLISLGIPSKYLTAVPGSGRADIIKFKIIRAGV